MKIVCVQEAAFDSGAELTKLTGLGIGAVASFTGIARADGVGERQVKAIELEHYPEMTEPALEALVAEASQRWELAGCVLIHRVGLISVGEGIVFVGTASAHRAAALSACAFLIDRLKTDAPFWKKEHLSDDSAEWVRAKESDDDRARIWQDD